MASLSPTLSFLDRNTHIQQLKIKYICFIDSSMNIRVRRGVKFSNKKGEDQAHNWPNFCQQTTKN